MKAQQRAFTLIEILIALFIFAVISTMVVVTLQQTFLIREQTQFTRQRLAQLQLALTIIERDIGQIVPGGVSPFLFQQNNDGTIFEFRRGGYVNPLFSQDRGTLLSVRYFYNNNQLTRSTLMGEQLGQQRVLLDNVVSLSWRFLGKNNNFYDLWPPTQFFAKTMPQAIECQLELKDWGKVTRLIEIPTRILQFPENIG